MADDVWYRIAACHSSCCGIEVLTAVRNPRESRDGYLSYYGSGFPDMPFNVAWRASEFDHSKWDEAQDAVPVMHQNVDWYYRFKTTKLRGGMQLLRFAALDAEVPENFIVLAENSHGKLIGCVHVRNS